MEEYTMSKLEEKLVAKISEETGMNVTFKRLTPATLKVVIAGNHEGTLDNVIMKFSEETQLYFDGFSVIHDGDCRTVAFLKYSNQEEYLKSLLRASNEALTNYNNMYGDIESFNETELIKTVEEVL